MEQQKRKGGDTVPDGFLEQQGFRIVIETKRGKDFKWEQAEGHSNHFGDAQRKILLLLGSALLNSSELDEMRGIILNRAPGVEVINTSFDSIISAMRAEITDWQEELNTLVEDYADYCYDAGLQQEAWKWMRMVLSGQTIEHNKSHNLYYDLVEHGYSAHDYLGLYTGKSVRAVGKIANILTVDIIEGKAVVKSRDFKNKVATAEQLAAIEDVVGIAASGPGYDIRRGHRFFFVEEFVETDFKKETPNAPMGKRFFDLTKYVDSAKPGSLPTIRSIASDLRRHAWK